ncbi:hypothetical protein H310_05284 [Aphanomyces invadans]|uniref:MATE efflux family protein n=1 Tax=Aphanomyces invadans TaxID=157072 RepID=A0A024U8Q1_9STRA|nr:hypothetical protein H310_05284 [Aphanomyces invadans]ETW02796.1 hypothetical protein H310_05284 [Aphanomyces invadans]|eukprot:XP_008868180.1 hypothetical protein H310_05284 [Aphanomyces invadans]
MSATKANEQLPLLAKYSTSGLAKDELTHVIAISLPLVSSAILEYVLNSINGMYTGHLSTEPSEVQLLLAANGLSYLFYALFLYSLAIGVGTALDAMCAQAHGRGAKAEIIVLLQTAVLCSAVLMIPIFFTCYFATDILLLLGQNPQVADVTGRLLWIMMFGLPFCFGYEIFKRILQSQNIVLPAVYGGVFANVTNVAVAYVLMYRTSLGFVGAAYSFIAVTVVYFSVSLYYVMQATYSDWIRQWHLHAAVAHLPSFLFLSAFGWFMFISEFASVALTSILAGLLPRANLAIASNNIFMGFRQVFFMVYMGLGVASSVRVGNALGANDPTRAKVAAVQTVGLACSWAVFTCVLMLALQHVFPHAYTNDPATLELTAQLMAVNAPFQIGFAIWMVMQGVFRGSARPHEGALWNVLAILVVGVPAGWFLASNYEWGILGIWVGISAGYAICAVFGLYWLATVDWVAMAKEASSRLTVDSPSHELLA